MIAATDRKQRTFQILSYGSTRRESAAYNYEDAIGLRYWTGGHGGVLDPMSVEAQPEATDTDRRSEYANTELRLHGQAIW